MELLVVLRPIRQPRQEAHAVGPYGHRCRPLAQAVVAAVVAGLPADVVPKPAQRQPSRSHEAPIEVRVRQGNAVEDEVVKLILENHRKIPKKLLNVKIRKIQFIN